MLTYALRPCRRGPGSSYDVDVQVGGKIASLAARFIEPTSRMLAGQFFEKLGEIAGKMGPVASAAPAAEPAQKKQAAKKPAAKKPAAKKPAASQESRSQEACAEEGRCKEAGEEEALICQSR